MSSGRRWLRATATSFVLEFADGAVTVAPPVASAKVVSVNGLAVQFDGSASFSTTSTITGYAWDFGDGTTASGQVASHTYAAGGTYTATLSVTDAVGGTASASAVVTVSGSSVNQSPIASFTVTVSGLTASVDGSGSSDPDGSVVSWAWTWGDSATSTGATASHAYMTAGTYPITLTVKDAAGATNSATKSVTVSATPINQAPVASFTFTVSGATVAVDGSGSTDADGTIASWAWTWGDGTTSTGKTATHTYGGAGAQTITLTVTDDKGAKGTATHTATTSTTTNSPPVASFTASGGSTGTVTFDASASTDPDGKVVTCTWNFGDGKSGTGLKVVHPYTTSSSPSVTLTVTDDKGAKSQVTKTVAVTVSGATGIVPNFDHIIWVWMENRTYDAIMSSTSAAPWFRNFANTNALFTDSHGVAHPSYPNYLAGFSGSTWGVTSDTVRTVGTSTTPTQYTVWKNAGLTFKGYRETSSPDKHNPWNSFTNSTAANADFSTFPTDYTQLPKFCWVVPNLMDDMHDGTIQQGDTWLSTHIGPLVTWAKTHNSLVVITWDEDDPYTSANHIPTAMAGQGVIAGSYSQTINHYSFLGMFCDSAGVNRFANAVGKAAITAPFSGTATPVYPPLTAAFTSTVSNLAATFNAVASSDSTSTISKYAWDFGDGTTGSGPSILHTYTSAKSYTVTLTVTDATGATATVNQTVTTTGGTTTGWTLNWSDEFTGSAVNSTVWNVDNLTNFGAGNNELEVQLASNATVANGLLSVTARKLSTPITVNGTAYYYSSAHLSTLGKKTFLIGPSNPIRVEVRAQLPDVTHLLAGPIWMRPADGGMGEVDLAEATGTTDTDNPLNQRISQTVHTLTYTPDVFSAVETVLSSANGVKDWHVYAMEITSTETRFYVDGVKTATINANSIQHGTTSTTLGSSYGQIFGVDRPWFFHITLGVGGTWPGTPTAATIFPAVMNLDYVRVLR